jgi:DNA-3-methyladenine glycosylase II
MSPAKLDSAATLDLHLAALLARDQRLRPIAERAGPFEIRRTAPGFAGLAKVICGHQLSVASARAIWGRFEALEGATDPRSYLALSEEAVRAAGFSAGKYRTVRGIAEALDSGALDLDLLAEMPAPNAVAGLTQLKGVGPWTAEIYLMFCAGHPDIFPAGDLALQKAVAHGLGLDARPSVKALIALAEPWSPYRATAALLFWRYYAALGLNAGVLL